MADESVPKPCLKTTTIYVPRQPFQIDFFAYERVGGSPEDAAELDALRQRLQQRTDIDRFQGQTSSQDHEAGRKLLSQSCGYTTMAVLPELIGLPLSDLVLGWLLAVRPSAIRITRGWVHCDAYPWRVTVIVDETDKITAISQEVGVGYGCGSDLAALLREAKTGEPARPCSGVIGNTAALERVDFQ